MKTKRNKKHKEVSKHIKHTRLSLGCVHLLEDGVVPVLADEMEPINEGYSGKTYVCIDCFERGKTSPKGKDDMANWVLICEGCITNKIITSLIVKK
ncbi:MAG: hypothetical protein Q8P21_01815 [bacterium]|nr:hypothetical protein [bacterium]